MAFRIVRNQEDAWELAQETFVRAYNAIPKFKGVRDVKKAHFSLRDFHYYAKCCQGRFYHQS